VTRVLLALLAVGVSMAPQQPPRDGTRGTAVGTASLSGAVLTGDGTGQPVRRAIVTISGATLAVGRSTVTDDEGRFAFDGLPAGRFSVTAARRAFLTSAFGATRPGGPGTPVQLDDGAHVSNIVIAMPRGAVLTGAITDPTGAPVQSLSVMVYQLVTHTVAGSIVTDDRGVYRVYGLPPGEYVVAADPDPILRAGETGMMSGQEVDAALRALERRGARAAPILPRPGVAPPPDSEPIAPLRAFSNAPIFYPGTAVAADAMPIAVAAGEERGGLDFIVAPVPMGSIAGMVIGTDGRPAGDVAIWMSGTGPSNPLALGRTSAAGPGRTRPDGSFEFRNVSPGAYRVTASRRPTSTGDAPFSISPGRGADSEWATADVALNGEHLDGISMVLQPGLRVSGRVVFEGTGSLPSDLTAMRVTVTPVPAPVGGSRILPIPVGAKGTFEITNLLPGAYALGLTLPAGVAEKWWPRSGLAGGRDVLDFPLDLQAGTGVPEVVFTLSDRRSSVSGVLQAADGQRRPEHVVLFSADRADWHPRSRRIRAVRPATDGSYRVDDIPPGEYLIAVLSGAEPDGWHERTLLERLAASAIRLTIAEGEEIHLDR
jgi:hypothetical protein